MKSLKLRSQSWFTGPEYYAFSRRAWLRSEGFNLDVFDGRPVIGIANSASELNNCNLHLTQVAEAVRRGVWQAGGFPLVFPTMSLGEMFLKPTAMLFRNLMAMEVEESIRGNPIDGVVLLGGCDKTTPGQVMGAASVDLPTIVVSSGPMLNGTYKGRAIGSGTDVWKFSEAVRAGEMSLKDFMAAESGMSRSRGTCMTMGTASTMACLMEAMGLSLPFNGTLPAVDARRQALAHMSGMRIVELIKTGQPLSQVLTRQAFENAIRVCAAIGGSTNAVLHLLAITGRIGVDVSLKDWDRVGRDVPLLIDLMPSGRFLMEDFHYAGGLPALMREIADLLHTEHVGVSGRALKDIMSEAETYNAEVIRPRAKPLVQQAGIAVLYGNLAPGGAVLKPSAASSHLLRHRGRAVVFSSIEDFHRRVDDPSLDIDESCVMVLQGCGPQGYPGMPEVGNMPLPKKLLERGVRDMVRISDARMSGTAFGTVVLHVTPEAHAGGPLALVRDGDMIDLDVAGRSLTLDIPDTVLAARRNAWTPPASAYPRGYYNLYVNTVTQADQGADLAFLKGGSGAVVTRESH
ncbi:MAG TPA: dihydroxy-acid dehydratase [Alphaproteobacteria bacterium]|nr:dihydroxy-acid dehydratase [Alphaproteobacteria bacterium]